MSSLLRTAMFTALVATAVPAAAGARADLTTFTQGLRTLQGGFSQVVYDANGRKKEQSTGRVAMSAPRLFRWEYVRPYQQLIVADGRTVWVYDPDLQQVSKRVQGQAEATSPLAALVEPTLLERHYTLTELPNNDGLSWLRLAPKTQNDAFRSATIGFNNGSLSRMTVVDGLGQRIEFTFAAWQRNPRLANATFTFTPPRGVDVVGQ